MLVMYLSSASVYSGDFGNKTVCYQGASQCFSCVLILSPLVGLGLLKLDVKGSRTGGVLSCNILQAQLMDGAVWLGEVCRLCGRYSERLTG